MTEANTHTLSAPELRKFGLQMTGLLLLFGEALPYLRHHKLPVVPLCVSGGLLGLAIFFPHALARIQRGWLALGRTLGTINSKIILTIFYYTVMLFVGTIFRLFGIDKMKRKFASDAASYRVNAKAPKDRKQLERIF